MRPLSLRIAGFTSFREEQTIEFADLDLFAITGPTGSGKSSVLDAITYALYGKAERVQDGVRQLVSQGQPSARVELTFEVDGSQYRVSRLTQRQGPTRILLERLEAGAWVQFGPGADRVREVEAAVVKLIGLDYVAFSRSVLLPQGQFHRFLSGDAHERRNILTDLLGLRLYERMAALANQQANTAAMAATTAGGLLESEYAGVSAESLAEAEKASGDAANAAAMIESARAKLAAIAARVGEVEGQARLLARMRADADALALRAEAIRTRVIALDAEAQGAATALAAQQREVARAEATIAKAASELAALVARSGSRPDIDAALEHSVEATTHLGAAGRAKELASKLEGDVARLQEALEVAAAGVAERGREEELARGERDAALRRRDEMGKAHTVAELLVDKRVGDACPVCGKPLETIPDPPGAAEVAAAANAVASRERDLATAVALTREAEAAQRDAERELSGATTRIATLKTQGVAESRAAEELLKALRKSLKLAKTVDPRSELEARRHRLLEAEDMLGAAKEELRAAERERDARRSTVEVKAAAIAGQRDALTALGLPSLLEQATEPLGIKGMWTSPPAGADAATVASSAGAAVSFARTVAADAATARKERETIVLSALDEARSVVGPLGLQGDSVASLTAAADRSAQLAVRQAERATALVESLRERLVRRAELAAAVARDEHRASVMRALALELRSDRLVAFVQGEALERLAMAASAHLQSLSEGRYRLACAEDEFEVIDTWNGDERRNVRTLSGGETFLASLALALSLAEQLSELAVGGHARLDSLFLDEGFGSLDPETLETVTAAVEALREGGRLVGIITHVAELADRMPARFVVRKSPRGSRIAREDTGLAVAGQLTV
jgi:exonuclease SbcC